MMVNCPKCGFSQPQDQYCASCGIDMHAYRPVRKPMAVRFLQNPVFQIAAVIMVGLSVFTSVRMKERAQLAERLSAIENAQSAQVTTKSLAGTNSESNPPATSDDGVANPESVTTTAAGFVEPPPGEPSGESTAASTAEPAQAPAATGPSPASVGEEPAASTRSATGASTTVAAIKVTFADMSAASIARLLADSDTVSNGPLLSGVVANLQSHLKSDVAGTFNIVDASALTPLTVGKARVIYSGRRDESSEQFLGFAIEITPIKIDDAGAQLQVRIWRGLRVPNANPQIEEVELPMPDSYTLAKGAAIAVTGTLPRRVSDAGNLYRDNRVLRILARDEYKSGANDLAIFIEAH